MIAAVLHTASFPEHRNSTSDNARKTLELYRK
jgi:hypothetical protein